MARFLAVVAVGGGWGSAARGGVDNCQSVFV